MGPRHQGIHLGLVVIITAVAVLVASADSVGAQAGWQPLGPRSGFVWDLAISPAFTQDSTIFAGISGGVLKSTDGGDSWQMVNKGLTSRFVPAIAVSPGFASDQTLFAGTTHDGVFRSVDGGKSWAQHPNAVLKTAAVESLAVSPDYENNPVAFAGTFGQGVFRSSDGGDSWRRQTWV